MDIHGTQRMNSNVFCDPIDIFLDQNFILYTRTIQCNEKIAITLTKDIHASQKMTLLHMFYPLKRCLSACLKGTWEYLWMGLLTVRVCDILICVCCFVFIQRTRWSRRQNTATTRTSLTASPTWREHTHTPDTGGALVRHTHTQINTHIHTIKVSETETHWLHVHIYSRYME